MAKEKPARKPYPSDLTDEQWTILAPLMPTAPPPRGGRPREVDMREVVNTILYLNPPDAAQAHVTPPACIPLQTRCS